MKKCTVLVLVVIMLIAMTACGSAPVQEPASESSQASPPGSSLPPTESSEPNNTASSGPDSDAAGPNGEIEPNISNFEGAEITVKVQFLNDNSIKIIVNDPYLFEYYYVNEALFTMKWEIQMTTYAGVVAYMEAELRHMGSSYPVVVDANGIDSDGDFNHTFTLDFEKQELVWVTDDIHDGFIESIAAFTGTAEIKYGFSSADKEMVFEE